MKRVDAIIGTLFDFQTATCAIQFPLERSKKVSILESGDLTRRQTVAALRLGYFGKENLRSDPVLPVWWRLTLPSVRAKNIPTRSARGAITFARPHGTSAPPTRTRNRERTDNARL